MLLRRTLGWLAAVIGGSLLLVASIWQLADTQPGRDFLVGQLFRIAPATGLRVEAERITGSIYGEMTIEGLELRDLEGVFLTAPEVRLAWRPAPFFRERRLVIDNLAAAEVDLARRPVLRRTGGPLLPDLRIELNRLRID
jgi:translocation and assembly module TamB